MNKKALNPRPPRRCERRDVVLIVVDNATPGCPVYSASFPCRRTLQLKPENRSGCWQAVQGHIHQQGVAARSRRPRGGSEPLPIPTTGPLCVPTGGHKTRKNRCPAEIRRLA